MPYHYQYVVYQFSYKFIKFKNSYFDSNFRLYIYNDYCVGSYFNLKVFSEKYYEVNKRKKCN